MAERHTVEKDVLKVSYGAYGVMAAQHTVDVLVWVRNPLGTPRKQGFFALSPGRRSRSKKVWVF